MNRQIKFRAWKNGKMYFQEYCGGFCYFIEPSSFLKEKQDAHSLEDFFVLADRNDCVLQQFTGLLDKNGKEIYEGDIVSYEAGAPNRNDGCFYKSISEVKFKNGAFWPRPMKEECEDSWYDYELKNICIIGNIFRNPELLE